MAELGLRERLQPVLLDRLMDDERMLTVFDLIIDGQAVRTLGLQPKEMVQILTANVAALGLTPRAEHEDAASNLQQHDGPIRLHFMAPGGRVSVSRLKSLALRWPGASREDQKGIPLQSFCAIEVRSERNLAAESIEQRQVSMRRLRELVCRDLAVLLNSTNLDTSMDLSDLPYVQSSVLNYGMPSFVGRSPKSLELRQVAKAVEEAIRRFEPRLTDVRVTPELPGGDEEQQIHLRIDAQLWGQPARQHLVLRTRISTESGEVAVSDSGSPSGAR